MAPPVTPQGPSLLALTRAVSPNMAGCELTHVVREVIDDVRAAEQHRLYVRCLENLGCRVEELPGGPDMPDCVFIEDTAVVTDELAVICRPGAESRRPETRVVAEALRQYRRVRAIVAPGTIDGGDVLRIGRDVFVGETARTNAAGRDQLVRALKPHGYTIRSVPVTGCLHLKSAVTQVAENRVLLNPAWVDVSPFSSFAPIEVHPGEPFGANALLVGDSVVYSSSFPETRRRMESEGIKVLSVDASELAKAEGGVTCCSLLVQT